MLQDWKTVRIFISSTFKDMHAERDYLVRFVFPRLREDLIKRRIHLVDVDLRWGVTSEQDAMETCREIIDECRPRFICMLGGRYGWTPSGQEFSITASEVQYAVLSQSDQTQYHFFYFRDPRITASIPEKAARSIGYREFAQPEDIKQYGLEKAEELARERANKLEQLKQEIVSAGFFSFIYSPRWDDNNLRLVELEEFGDKVYKDIIDSILDDLDSDSSIEIDEFTTENCAMESFLVEHTGDSDYRKTYYVGSRRPLLDSIIAFAQSDSKPSILIIKGESGSGKSSLLCRFYQEYVANSADDLIIPHFVGASIGSTLLRSTLRRICKELSSGIGLDQAIPDEVNELVQLFGNLLKIVAETRRVVLILDAINQFDEADDAYTMFWLPQELPPKVKVIVSSLEHPALEALLARREQVIQKELNPLTNDDVINIIEGYLDRYKKRMNTEEKEALLSKSDSKNPLYLLAVLGELRTLGSYEELLGNIRMLPGEVQQLFIWILKERLSKEPGFYDSEGRFIGAELVQKFASYIGASRYGLSQAELIELIDPGDPRGNVAALQRFLMPYLMQRGELLDFYHGQLGEAVRAAYLSDDEAYGNTHKTLADFFEKNKDDYVHRTLSELSYHLYQYACISGDNIRLFDLVDDDAFRKRKFELNTRTEPIIVDIGYAIDLAVRSMDFVRMVHFSLMRINVTRALSRTYLNQLFDVASSSPDLARGVVELVVDPTLRRVGFVYLAWILCKDKYKYGLARDIIYRALNIDVAAKVSQVPILLRMIKDLYLNGIYEAKGLITSIPECPIRNAYMAAWEKANGPTAVLANAMKKLETPIHTSSVEEIAEFRRANNFVEEFLKKDLSKADILKIENYIIKTFGPEGSSDIYLLIAAERMNSGAIEEAQIMITHGIALVEIQLFMPAIRTLSALVEMLNKAGEHDLAEEHADRVREFLKGMEKMGSNKNSAYFEDLSSEINIAIDQLSKSWQSQTVTDLVESKSAEFYDTNKEKEDALSRLGYARQLLANGKTKYLPKMLRNILDNLKPNGNELQREAILVCVFMMSRAIKDEALESECCEYLAVVNLPPADFFIKGTRINQSVLNKLAHADTRCVAAFSLCFRLIGLNELLFEFIQVASKANSSPEVLDAILSQVVRLPVIKRSELRVMSDDIISTGRFLSIPQGLGIYYYPGLMLLCAWLGTVFLSIGFRAVLDKPQFIIIGLIYMAGGLAGGFLDLAVWRGIHLWEKPEISRRYISSAGSLLFFGVMLLCLRFFLKDYISPAFSLGIAITFILSIVLILMSRFILFSPLNKKFIGGGTAIAAVLVAVFSYITHMLYGLHPEYLSSLIYGGIFLGGVLLSSFVLNILPKYIAVRKRFGNRGDFNTNIL